MNTFKPILLCLAIFTLFFIAVVAKAYFSWQVEYELNHTYQGVSLLFSLGFASNISTYMISKKIGFKVHPFNCHNAEYKKKLIDEQGEKNINKQTIILAIVFFTLFGGYALIVNKGFDFYEESQLEKYGERQLVEISEIRKGPKGSKLAYIKFNHKGVEYEKELYLMDRELLTPYQIIYSERNPKIIRWLNDL